MSAEQHALLAQGAITGGAMFRRLRGGLATPDPMSDRAVARVVQARAAAAGYDPARFAGHSLRAASSPPAPGLAPACSS